MRILFEIDYKNYKENGTVGKRPSARAIIIKDNKIAMVYSKKYDYFKFPGGGIESSETNIDALIREVKEEVGLEVIKESIKEYGLVIRKEKGKVEDIFIQENYYYLCRTNNSISNQKLDYYEKEEGFTLKLVDPRDAINTNLNNNHNNTSESNMHIIEREAKVLMMLIDEKYL